MCALALVLGLAALSPTAASAAETLPSHVADVKVGAEPQNVAVDDEASRVYVSNHQGGSVTVVDADDHSVIDTIDVGGYPAGLTVGRTRHRLYVTDAPSPNAYGALTVVDTQTLAVLDSIPLGRNPANVAVNETTGRVYVASVLDNTVAVLDPETYAVEATIVVGYYPMGMDVDEATNRVFVANFLGSSVSVIDGATNAVATTFSAGEQPIDVAFSPGRNELFVLKHSPDYQVRVFDGDDYGSVAQMPTANNPAGVAVSESTGMVYVVNSREGRLSVYGTSNTLVGEVPLEDGDEWDSAYGIDLDQTTGRIYTTGENTDRLQVWQEEFAPTITTPSLPAGVVGTAYDETIVATGSTPISFTVSDGTLPEGLVLESDGRLHGTPEQETTAAFIVTAGNTAGESSRSYALAVGRAPTITTETLPSGLVGDPYDQTLEVTGTAPVAVELTDGELPAGLTLSDAGQLSGELTAEGDFDFTLTARNPYGEHAREFRVSARVAPQILTASLAAAVVDEPYSQQIEASGTAPLTFAVADGTLPDGLQLDASTGEISGIPAREQVAAVTVSATNAAGSDEQELVIDVGLEPSILTSDLPVAVLGVGYDQTVAVAGTDPVVLAVTSGALPDGLTLDGTTGHITGTPDVAGAFDVTLTATNAQGEDSQGYTIAVGIPPQITTADLPGTVAGADYESGLDADGTAPVTWTIEEGALPAGLQLDADTGRLAGIATIAGSYDVTLEASSPFGVDTMTYQIDVAPADLAAIELTANARLVDEGGSLTFAVTGTDAFDNPLGDLTDEATLTSDHPDQIDGATVTFTTASEHVITATIGAVSDSVVITVVPRAVTDVPGAGGVGGGGAAGDGALPGVGSSVPPSATALALAGILAGALLLVSRRGVSSRRS